MMKSIMIEEHDDLDQITDKPVEVQVYVAEAIFRRLVHYQVLVEGWDKAKHGRGRRNYLKEFTEEERALLSRYQVKFRDWYLGSGPPAYKIRVRIGHLHTLQRAVAFFAAI